MNLRQLPALELHKAHESADYLLGLAVGMDRELVIKLDTFRADVRAEIEDRDLADLGARRVAITDTE